ncbi:MAG TPA: lamin tail domain-containing protein [Pyrinomonadaceae bacterium]
MFFATHHSSAQTQTQPGQVIISELRLRGPAGPQDEFVEIYNNTDQDIIVQSSDGTPGWAVAISNGEVTGNIFVIPNGTRIPARGHFLGAGAAYSLSGYPSGPAPQPSPTPFLGTTPDVSFDVDIPDGSGVALFNSTRGLVVGAAARLDAFGFTSSPALFKEGSGFPFVPTGLGETTLFRDMRTTGGLPKDTNDNAADFLFAAPTQSISTANSFLLGAPGPENLASPVLHNSDIAIGLLDPAAAPAAVPNRERRPNVEPNADLGSLLIRRTFTNNTGQAVTRLRFRVFNITGPGTENTCGGPVCADVRALTSQDGEAGSPNIGVVTVRGVRLEEPPLQPNGGGFNSSLSADFITLATPLQPGQSVNLQFKLGIMRHGAFRFFFNIEALTAPITTNGPTALTTSAARR